MNNIGNGQPKYPTKNLFCMIKCIWKFTPSYPIVIILQLCGNAVWSILFNFVFVKFVFDAIETKKEFKLIFYTILVLSLFRIILILFDKWVEHVYQPKAKLKLHEQMQSELYKQALNVDISCYDNTKFYNDYIWAIRESDTRAIQIMKDVFGCIISIATLIGMLSFLFFIDPIIAIVIMAFSILNFYIGMRMNKIRYERSMKIQPLNRKAEYIKRVFYFREYAKDLREGEISSLLQSDYEETLNQEINCYKKYMGKIFGVSLASQLFTGVFVDIIVTIYIILRYIYDVTFSLGDFSTGINAISRLFVQTNTILKYFVKLNDHILYSEKFVTFMKLRPTMQDGTLMPEAFQSLELQNVSFIYPFVSNKNKNVLNHISLTIKRGEKVAFVGYNGAGKTTLVNLLLRLYDVNEGKILYNGIDIKDYKLNSYRCRLGAMMQDFKLFAATIGENIVGGPFCEANRNGAIMSIKRATFIEKFKELPNGFNTMITKEFDAEGANFSGGEMQKIAMARTFFKNSDVIIMDEPSSALDPNAEYELNNVIREESLDKTIIYISHRLANVRMADRIYVLDNSEIIECGSHEELMKLNGKYAEMFLTQAKKYIS